MFSTYAKLEKRKKNGDIKPVNVAELLDQVRQTWTDRVAMDGKELRRDLDAAGRTHDVTPTRRWSSRSWAI